MISLTGGKSYLHISPHLDDAVFSSGGLIARQVADGAHVMIATMVTADPKPRTPLSPLAQRYLAAWGSPAAPFADRCIEDINAIKVLGAEWRHEGLLDCTYRFSPSGRILYGTMEQLFSATPDPEDMAFIGAVSESVAALIDERHPDAIFTPATVGRHVDHVCVLSAVQPVAHKHRVPLYLWEDQPYSCGVYPPDNPDRVVDALKRIGHTGAIPVIERIDPAPKMQAARCYVSQIKDLYASPEAMDRVMTDYASSLGAPYPAERYWRVEL